MRYFRSKSETDSLRKTKNSKHLVKELAAHLLANKPANC